MRISNMVDIDMRPYNEKDIQVNGLQTHFTAHKTKIRTPRDCSRVTSLLCDSPQSLRNPLILLNAATTGITNKEMMSTKL
jgi:hypothetical protein